jgi:hypothetical protein
MKLRTAITAVVLAAAIGSPLAARPLQTTTVARSGSLADEAAQREKAGQWLGAFSAWRDYARLTEGVDEDGHARALGRLHDVAGISWLASLKEQAAGPMLLGRDVVLVSSHEPAGLATRNVVSAIDRASGNFLWRREDAVAMPQGGDVLVLVQNHEHVVRVQPHSGADMWQAHLASQHAAHRVLGVRDGMVFVQTDGWPAAYDLATGAVRWQAREPASRGGIAWRA